MPSWWTAGEGKLEMTCMSMSLYICITLGVSPVLKQLLWFPPASNRNPDHGARPSAKHIAKELSGPQLRLALSEDTPSALPACTLGAPLEEGRELYQDLQTKYN